MPKPLTVWITITVHNSSRDGNTRAPDLPLEKPICRSGSNRTGHGTTDRFQIGKGVRQGCILSPCLFNFYAENLYLPSSILLRGEHRKGKKYLYGNYPADEEVMTNFLPNY